MELFPKKLFPVTLLPIFLVIPTKLIPKTKKAAGNIFGGGGTLQASKRCRIYMDFSGHLPACRLEDLDYC